jgi:hypothetical protein
MQIFPLPNPFFTAFSGKNEQQADVDSSNHSELDDEEEWEPTDEYLESLEEELKSPVEELKSLTDIERHYDLVITKTSKGTIIKNK